MRSQEARETRYRNRRFTGHIRGPLQNPSERPLTTHWLDTWLPRLSHFSQFGLFLFTVGAIYFTVIPLYQKALLEESIAKKEIELKQVSVALVTKENALKKAQEELTAKVAILNETKAMLVQTERKRYVQQRGYELWGFLSSRGRDCTLVLDPPSGPRDLDDHTKRPAPHETILNRDPAECILKAFQESNLRKLLEPSDVQFFQAELEKVAVNFRSLKASAVKDIASLADRARRDRSLLSPAAGFEAQMNKILSRVRVIGGPEGEAKREVEFERALTRTKNNIAYDYRNSIISTMINVRSVAWPQLPP